MFRELQCVTDEPIGALRVVKSRKIETSKGILIETLEDFVEKTEDTPPFDEYTAKELIENGINMNPASSKFLESKVDDLFTNVNPNENE